MHAVFIESIGNFKQQSRANEMAIEQIGGNPNSSKSAHFQP